MTHLSHDELVDAVEGMLGPDGRLHLQQCADCRSQAATLGAVLREARDVAVPEPSPLFWTHLSTRVRDAIAVDEAAPERRSPPWLRWPVLAPIAALASLILVLASALPRTALEPATGAVVTSEPATDLARVGEPGWAIVSEIVGSVDLEVAQDAGIVRLGDAERAALQLSAAEQEELVRLMQEEMGKAGG